MAEKDFLLSRWREREMVLNFEDTLPALPNLNLKSPFTAAFRDSTQQHSMQASALLEISLPFWETKDCSQKKRDSISH